MSVLAKKRSYTFEDYLTWNDDMRCELIYGQIYNMASPSSEHQRVSREVLTQLSVFLKGKTCQVFSAPFDVRLNADEYDDIVVQPDILVICDKSKLQKGHGCKGAPDMVTEIVSPSSVQHDMVTKFQLYQQAGVREYWLIDYENKIVTVHILENGKYFTTKYAKFTKNSEIPVHVLDGCVIDLAEVFTDE